MSLYEKFGALALRLIDKFGQDAEFVINRDDDPPDSTKPWLIKDTLTTTHKVRMAFLPDDRDQRESKNFTRRSSVARGNLQAYLGPVPFKPSLKDSVIRGDRTYSIESIVEYRPSAHEASLYTIRLK